METNHLKIVNDLLNEAQDMVSKNINKEKISAIERDLILEKLRKAYDLLIMEHKVEKQVVITTTQSPVNKINVEKTPELPTKPKSPEIKPQVFHQTPVEQQKEKPEIVREIRKEPVVKKFEKVDFPEKSIFDDVKKDQSKNLPSSVKDKQPGEILADKYQGTKKFRNDTLTNQTGKKDISSKQQNKPIGDLTKAIGINEKFLFIKELFNGDSELYNNTLKKLNQFTDIAEAMIYIHENFSWKSENVAANKFIDLIRRKLLNE